jgi:hypothetical protein
VTQRSDIVIKPDFQVAFIILMAQIISLIQFSQRFETSKFRVSKHKLSALCTVVKTLEDGYINSMYVLVIFLQHILLTYI